MWKLLIFLVFMSVVTGTLCNTNIGLILRLCHFEIMNEGRKLKIEILRFDSENVRLEDLTTDEELSS